MRKTKEEKTTTKKKNKFKARIIITGPARRIFNKKETFKFCNSLSHSLTYTQPLSLWKFVLTISLPPSLSHMLCKLIFYITGLVECEVQLYCSLLYYLYFTLCTISLSPSLSFFLSFFLSFAVHECNLGRHLLLVLTVSLSLSSLYPITIHTHTQLLVPPPTLKIVLI